MLEALARRIKHWAEAIDTLAGIDVSAGGSHLEWLARGLEELRHAEHLRFGLREWMQLGSARSLS
jgi:hypothetical protein